MVACSCMGLLQSERTSLWYVHSCDVPGTLLTTREAAHRCNYHDDWSHEHHASCAALRRRWVRLSISAFASDMLTPHSFKYPASAFAASQSRTVFLFGFYSNVLQFPFYDALLQVHSHFSDPSSSSDWEWTGALGYSASLFSALGSLL